LFYRAIKYQRLYRHEIGDGLVLAWGVENHLRIYNSVRPYEAVGFITLLARLPAGLLHPARGQLAGARNCLRLLTQLGVDLAHGAAIWAGSIRAPVSSLLWHGIGGEE
jgi:hypothetical protein